jgi:hypothetical protein
MPKFKRKKKESSSTCSTDTDSDSRCGALSKSQDPLSKADAAPDSQCTPTLVGSGGPPITPSPVECKTGVNSALIETPEFEGFSHPALVDSYDEDTVITPAQRSGRPDNGNSLLNRPNLEYQNSFSQNEKVFIIEPIENEIPVSKFFFNDIALSKSLANSPFGKDGIDKVSKNLTRKLLIISLRTDSVSSEDALLSVSKIGSWNVKCRLPINQTSSFGVIGPFGQDTTDEEVKEALTEGGYSVNSAQRIFKGKEKTKTSMFKIHFSTATMPPCVRIGYQQYKVNVFIGQPWQCFKCQRFGHSATHCRSNPRCVACSGPHNVKDCTSHGTASCCNCGGNHTASYGGCPKLKQAKMIEKTRQVYKLSYKDALAKVITSDRQTNKTAENTKSSSYPLTFTSAEQREETVNVPVPSSKTVGTQTSDMPTSQTLQNVSVSQLIELLTKLLATIDSSEAKQNPLQTITKLTEETLLVKTGSTTVKQPTTSGIMNQSLVEVTEIVSSEAESECSDMEQQALTVVQEASSSKQIVNPTHSVHQKHQKRARTAGEGTSSTSTDQLQQQKKVRAAQEIQPSPIIGGKSLYQRGKPRNTGKGNAAKISQNAPRKY